MLEERNQARWRAFESPPSTSAAASYNILGPGAEPAGTEKDDPEGPEPAYANVVSGYQTYHHRQPFALDYGGHLPEFDLAYETWGELNADRSNAVLLHTGLSASSHAHSTAANPAQGWWEKFIGPGKALDTDKFFVICTNVLGGCYGSTGPSSLDPSDGKPYATRFPVLSVFDMVRAQFELLSHLGIQKLAASVGSSMGGMQSIAAAHLEPERVGKVVSISGTARSSPASMAMRYAQRSGESRIGLLDGARAAENLDVDFSEVSAVLMADPNWKRGFYYEDLPPHTGMKLARRKWSWFRTVARSRGPRSVSGGDPALGHPRSLRLNLWN
ncbi:MAG: alpha/beta fold hydrolase [Microbacterium hominis]|nr:alpha/beta fold hydrolase [Microbacterium hominis]